MGPSPQERQQIAALVAQFEADTGIQAVAAVTDKADAYPDIPWKAYAMGSALGACVAALDLFPVHGWSHAGVIALDAMLIMAGGALLALLASFIAPIGRLFLDKVRAEGEALQYAQGLFLDRELFRTKNRRALLIVMCRFERRAVFVADTGLRPHTSPAALAAIGASAGRLLAAKGLVPAFEAAFTRIKQELTQNGFEPAPAETDGIADDLVEEKRV